MTGKYKIYISSAPYSKPSDPVLINGTIEECLIKAHKYGADGIDYHIRESASPDYDNILRIMEEYGVGISSIITGRLCTESGYTLLNPDVRNSEMAYKGLIKYIDMASAMKTDIILGWAKGRIPDGAEREEYIDRLGEYLRRLEVYAAEKSVRINIEAVNRYESNLLNTSNEICEFLEDQRLNNCYVHLDVFHMNIEESDMCKAILRAGKRLNYIHFADNERRYPGSGALDFKKIMNMLDECGYDGPIAFEYLPQPDMDTAVEKGLRHIREIEG